MTIHSMGVMKKMNRFFIDDCEFIADFVVDSTTANKEYCELVFHGLDTICEIFLNGRFLQKTMNMHRTYTVDVKNVLQEEKNTSAEELEKN